MTQLLFPGLCALALLAVVGCDGIGRAIVDETGDRKRGPAECSDSAPECENVIPSVPPTPPPLSVPLGLESCASTSSRCPGTATSPDPSAPAQYPNIQGCSLDLAVSAGDFSALGRASCVVLQLLPVQPAPIVRLADLHIDRSSLVLHSDAPVVVELARSRLVGTEVTLRGPVTLRMVDQSSVQNVWIHQQPASTGVTSASFELVEGRAQNLTVGQLDGHVEVTRSTLIDSKLWAQDISLEAVAIQSVFTAARTMDAVELNGRGLALQVGRATLSQLELSELDVQSCQTMLLSGCRINKSKFAACSEGLRVDYTQVIQSMLLGPIESSVGTWIENAFGVGGVGTTIELWGGSQISNNYCAGVTRVSFGELSTLECNRCDQLPAPEQRLCPAMAFNEKGPRSLTIPEDNPLCPVLAEIEVLPVCAPPVRNEQPF